MSGTEHLLDVAEISAHTEFLRRLARRLVGDEHRADDLVQDALTVAIERPPRDVKSLRGWLAGVLRNRTRMAFRSDARRLAREASAPTRSESLDPRETVERLEVQRHLLHAVRETPEPFRTTLRLRFYDGLDVDETARRMGVPAGTVRSRTARALVMLRERLDTDHDGDRRAWSLLLLPLSGGRSAPLSGAGLTVGGIVMGVKGWVATAAILMVVVGLALVSHLGGGSPVPRPEPQPEGPETALASLPAEPGGLGEVPTGSAAMESTALPASPGSTGGRITGSVTVGGETAHFVNVSLVPVWAPDEPVKITTDRFGKFQFADLPPSRYRLTATRPLVAPLVLEVTLQAGRNLDGVALAFPRGRTLRVRVVDGMSRPLRRAAVESSTAWGKAVALTGIDGTTLFVGLGGDPLRLDVSGPRNPDGTMWWKKTVGPVVPEDQLIEVVLQRVVSLKGTVLDPEGEPLAHMHVQAFDVAIPNGFLNTRVTGADGTFEITFPEDRTIDLRVTGNLMPDGFKGEITRTGVRGWLRGIAAGSRPVVVRTTRIGMHRTLTVRILDVEGKPVAGAMAFANNMARAPIPSAVSGEDGRAVIADLPEEFHHVWVARGESLVPAGIACPEMTQAVPTGQEIEMRFIPGVVISGRVLGSEGEPVPGAEVCIALEGERITMLEKTKSDAEGRFTVTGLPDRKHCVGATIYPPGTRGIGETIRDYVSDGEELVIRLPTVIR